MKAPRRLGLSIALGIFLLDQLVKWVVMGPLKLGAVGAIELLPIFRFYFVQNYGVSMGFLTAGSDTTRWALVALTAAIGTGVLVWLWRETNRADIAALGLVLGGAAGDRELVGPRAVQAAAATARERQPHKRQGNHITHSHSPRVRLPGAGTARAQAGSGRRW
jgi:hypothetical protein